MSDIRTRIVILGGGFGGVYAAIELERALARDPSIEVTLVSRENFFAFTPMLHEVAASDLDVTHIVNPIRKLVHRVRFVLGDVRRIDLEARRVTVSHGSDAHEHDLPYDHLVIALGAVTALAGPAGVAEHAIPMKTLGDASRVRDRLIRHLEEAATECAAAACQREPLLTCVVAGGGFAGVETIAAINDFVAEALPHYPTLERRHVRMVLVHGGATLLPELPETLGRYAERKLAARGVEIRTGQRVGSVTAGAVTLDDGTTVPARMVIWTAGAAANPVVATLPCAGERGRVAVDRFLGVPGHPGLWAVGDCALVPTRDPAVFAPPTAQHALRQGRVVARNIVAAIRGRRPRAFDFTTLGQLAAIGRRTGVARILGVNFSGFVAWWLWRTIYLSKLPRTEKKLRVALDWTLDLVFTKDLVQLPAPDAPAPGPS